jgi:hypothetical protein
MENGLENAKYSVHYLPGLSIGNKIERPLSPCGECLCTVDHTEKFIFYQRVSNTFYALFRGFSRTPSNV